MPRFQSWTKKLNIFSHWPLNLETSWWNLLLCAHDCADKLRLSYSSIFSVEKDLFDGLHLNSFLSLKLKKLAFELYNLWQIHSRMRKIEFAVGIRSPFSKKCTGVHFLTTWLVCLSVHPTLQFSFSYSSPQGRWSSNCSYRGCCIPNSFLKWSPLNNIFHDAFRFPSVSLLNK